MKNINLIEELQTLGLDYDILEEKNTDLRNKLKVFKAEIGCTYQDLDSITKTMNLPLCAMNDIKIIMERLADIPTNTTGDK